VLYIQAQKPGDTRKYAARVLHTDHDTETALLTVDDPAFFDGTVPVRFGALPPRNAKVSVYGFPIGGDELCITAGVVSRIEVRLYTHSQRQLLALQTDAAINPGNSGGPVFMDGALIGIAFQSYKQKDLEKSGYVVPIPVIEHLFEDLADGAIGGVPDLGVSTQKIENEGLREYVGLAADGTGVLVSRVLHGGSAHGVLEEGDVLMAIDGTPVGCDGSIALRPGERVHYSYLIARHQVGSVATLRVLRRGAALELVVQLGTQVALVPGPQPDRRPSYFLFAGLVFVPLTYDYMASWEWSKVAPRYRHYYHDVLPNPRRRQIVLINEVLAHELTVGYHQIRGAVVDRINGVDIVELRDVVRALAEPLGKFHVIEIDYHGGRAEASDYHSAYGTRIVIDASRAAQATAEVLARNGIAADRSPDLR
jgi:S1-C subfamily serine protease